MSNGKSKRTVWVGNLEPRVTEEILFELFLQIAPLEDVTKPKNKNFAFILFTHKESPDYAVRTLNKISLFGQKIHVKLHEKKRKRKSREMVDRRVEDCSQSRGRKKNSRRSSPSGFDDRVNNSSSRKDENENDTGVTCTGPASESVNFIHDFNKTGFNRSLRKTLKKLNIQTPTPVQSASIPAIMLKRDIIACAHTGSGKTAAYLLPIVDDLMKQNIKAESAERQFPQALIVSPDRTECRMIYEQCCMFAKGTGIMAQCLHKGMDIKFARKKIQENGCNILIGTAQRVNDVLEKLDFLELGKLQYFVIDEAELTLDVRFGPIKKLLVTGRETPGKRQTLMFSATFSPILQRFATEYLDSETLFIKVD
ncbi:Oidioi.mRNA.OKI2018_I69.XSR.g16581.t1.cds [Oikopleura dioica]|uniref:RNA helicase n=1 Tax=Oikopleura dioica TaxID=34765 RepID=A0ABN7SGJ8_OIKDI|nr:Oidioi.mRNA.OKI2018_I69.XSR.g16581.t1.cds [Oikopleura dioica]